LVKIEMKFGQNKNLASLKTIDLLRLWAEKLEEIGVVSQRK